MMAKDKKALDLVLTLDYELFGDGSGDVFELMIRPTEDFLSLCDKYNIKTTIFFEVMEYLKMQEEWEKGNMMNYSQNPAEAIRNQIISAHNSGHDIQLHIHPHWINSRYENGRWILDSRYWKLTKVPEKADADFPLGLEELIALGKDSIEGIIKPIDPAYRCHIFRAGGYCITPSEKIISVLKKLGFTIDSSVIPGAYHNDDYYYYDFRNISLDRPFWGVGKSVDTPLAEAGDFIEVPVFAKPMRRFKKYDLQRLRIALKHKESNLERMKGKVENKPGLMDKLRFFMEKESLTWDFCLFSQAKMKDYFNFARSIAEESKFGFHPFVLIGHSKGFLVPEVFEKFIIKNRTELNFLTLKKTAEKIRDLHSSASTGKKAQVG